MIGTEAIGVHAIGVLGGEFVPSTLTEPGLEFTLPERRLHFTLPERVLHFTLDDEDE